MMFIKYFERQTISEKINRTYRSIAESVIHSVIPVIQRSYLIITFRNNTACQHSLGAWLTLSQTSPGFYVPAAQVF